MAPLGYADRVSAARERTEELSLSDLVQPPPVPRPDQAPRRPTPAPAPAGPAARRQRPRSRLLRAYWATFQIVLSYAWLALQRRFRTPDRMDALTYAAHRRNAHRAREAIVDLQLSLIHI